MDYLDFELEIGPGNGAEYAVAVLRSPAGQGRATMRLPFDEQELKRYLGILESVARDPLVRSADPNRGLGSLEEFPVQDFGTKLFDAVFNGEVGERYNESRNMAEHQDKGLRLKLRLRSKRLAALPWEYLYDSRLGDYVCLSRYSSLVRYPELPRSDSSFLMLTPPLRVLGVVASPTDMDAIDVGREKQRIEEALADLQEKGMVDLSWLKGQTWHDLQIAMRGGPWHIFHFIGHGEFDHEANEGFIALVDDAGNAHRFHARNLARELADHRSLRLAVLNSCRGARGNGRDNFSSTASILMQRGLPAVLAMQYEISDRAAIEFSRAFYESLVQAMSVELAVADARRAISYASTNSIEWGTPVLYTRSVDGRIFDIKEIKQIEPPESPASPVKPSGRARPTFGAVLRPSKKLALAMGLTLCCAMLLGLIFYFQEQIEQKNRDYVLSLLRNADIEIGYRQWDNALGVIHQIETNTALIKAREKLENEIEGKWKTITIHRLIENRLKKDDWGDGDLKFVEDEVVELLKVDPECKQVGEIRRNAHMLEDRRSQPPVKDWIQHPPANEKDWKNERNKISKQRSSGLKN